MPLHSSSSRSHIPMMWEIWWERVCHYKIGSLALTSNTGSIKSQFSFAKTSIMTAFVGRHLHLLRIMTGAGGLSHQISCFEELCLLSRVSADGPGHLGRRPVQPGRAGRRLPLVWGRGGGGGARGVVRLRGRGWTSPGEILLVIYIGNSWNIVDNTSHQILNDAYQKEGEASYFMRRQMNWRFNLLLLAGDLGDSTAQLQGDFGNWGQHITLTLAWGHTWSSSCHLDLQGRCLGILLPRPLPLLVLLLVLLVLLVISTTSLSLLNIQI